jgi:hypothetical protein
MVNTHWVAAFGAIVSVARAAAAFFALVSALGFLWFLGYHDSLTIAYFMTTVVALIAFAVLPRRFLASTRIGTLVTIVAVAAVATTIPQMYRDLTLINGPDHPAFVLRGVVCAIFLLMGLEALTWTRLKVAV